MDGFADSLHFASKLRCDAGLYELFTGKYCCGRGHHPKYGGKVGVRKTKKEHFKICSDFNAQAGIVYLYLVTLHLF